MNIGLRAHALKQPAVGLLDSLHSVWAGGFTCVLLQDSILFDAQSVRPHGALHLYEDPEKLEHLNQRRFYVDSHLPAPIARSVFTIA